jgi:preprotein translocase subunit SecD
MRTEDDLRAAYAHLTDNPGRVEDLDLATVADASRARGITVAAIALTVAAIIGLSMIVYHGRGHRSVVPAGPYTRIICAAQGWQRPSPDQLEADRQTLLSRLGQIGVHDGTVQLESANRFVITAPGAAASQVATLCNDHPFEMRPLVAPAAPDTGELAGPTYPLSLLPFKPPTSDSGYRQLSLRKKQQIRSALEQLACAGGDTATATGDRVICDTRTPNVVALLLGPAILNGTQVSAATATPPDPRSGQTAWTVTISLRPAAQAVWSAYTAAHNTAASATPTSVSTCGSPQTPCANFVAFILDDTLIAIPATTPATSGTTTQISGHFDKAAATRIAALITNGQLASPLSTLSIHIHKPPSGTHR